VRRGLGRPSQILRAVDAIDLDIRAGETLGLVGESGSGKSTLCRLLVRLIEPTAGDVTFDGKDLRAMGRTELRAARRDMQIIFQDPLGSLDPRHTVGRIVSEGPALHRIGTKAERSAAVTDMLRRVGLRPESAHRYPHQFSGGQRQRIGIARALVLRPRLVVADEPVSALDVSVQSQILNLLVELKRDLALTYVFVAHDIAAVGYIADRVAVMHLGQIVELGPTREVLERPRHPYTKALLSAIPQLSEQGRARIVLRGEIPSPIDPPSGCRFRTRCPIAQDVCASVEPKLESTSDGHLVACHFADAAVPVMQAPTAGGGA
jgi:oligopeptide/dipeptide ABC transporter ATP-binding protein